MSFLYLPGEIRTGIGLLTTIKSEITKTGKETQFLPMDNEYTVCTYNETAYSRRDTWLLINTVTRKTINLTNVMVGGPVAD